MNPLSIALLLTEGLRPNRVTDDWDLYGCVAGEEKGDVTIIVVVMDPLEEDYKTPKDSSLTFSLYIINKLFKMVYYRSWVIICGALLH